MSEFREYLTDPKKYLTTQVKKLLIRKNERKTGEANGLQDLPRPKLIAGRFNMCKGL